MTEFAITSGQLMWLCTLIAGLWSVVKIIKEIRKPNDDLKKTVDRHSELLDNDNKRLKEHEEARDDLQKYLVDK